MEGHNEILGQAQVIVILHLHAPHHFQWLSPKLNIIYNWVQRMYLDVLHLYFPIQTGYVSIHGSRPLTSSEFSQVIPCDQHNSAMLHWWIQDFIGGGGGF
jgi:hypothetical protein